jgi:long-subunit fatty acid transport protein
MDLPHAEKGSTDSGTADGEVVVSASRTQVRFSAGYSLAASDYDPYSYQERTRVSTTVEYDLTAKFSLRAMGLYENGDYDVDSVVEGQTGTGGSDALTDAQFGISYRINRNLTASLSYEYEDWNSDIRESFSRNWVTAAVRAEM